MRKIIVNHINMQLFNKAILFTDIHFGLRHNSEEHNIDCLDFINWLISVAEENNCETCIMLGDWHHHRSNINILTLDYTMQALRQLNNHFEKTYIILGNHDLFYKEKRDIHSMIVGSEFENIILIDELTEIDNVAFVPWLVEEEWKKIQKITAPYIFGHLEIPGFKMNASIEMPDHGTINSSHFENQEYVFSGHFHRRQNKGKIHYIGNPFGHNYGDAWDFERGATIVEWGAVPQYIDYHYGPRFITIPLSSLLENPDLYLKEKTYLQVNLDVDITYEEAVFLRETFLTQYKVREFRLIKIQDDILITDIDIDSEVKTVDQLVIEQLTGIESTTIDSSKLIDIYNNL